MLVSVNSHKAFGLAGTVISSASVSGARHVPGRRPEWFSIPQCPGGTAADTDIADDRGSIDIVAMLVLVFLVGQPVKIGHDHHRISPRVPADDRYRPPPPRCGFDSGGGSRRQGCVSWSRTAALVAFRGGIDSRFGGDGALGIESVQHAIVGAGVRNRLDVPAWLTIYES